MQSKAIRKMLSMILSLSLILQVGIPAVYAGEQEKTIVISFEELSKDQKEITVPVGILEDEVLEKLPDILTATCKQTTTGGAISITLEDITWEIDSGSSASDVFDSSQAMNGRSYTYVAVLPDRDYGGDILELGEGVGVPKVNVLVEKVPIGTGSYTVFAEDTIIMSGDCGKNGNNLTYVLDGDEAEGYTLTISGDGEMGDYYHGSNPWDEYKRSIKKLILPDGLTSIGNYAFNRFNLADSLTIPESVTRIGSKAFEYYGTGVTSKENLKLNLPIGLNSIGESAFSGSGFIGDLSIPNGVTIIGKDAFKGCSSFTGTLTLPGSVKVIDGRTFHSGSFIGLELGEGIETIGWRSFFNFKIVGETSIVKIPSTVTSIGEGAFNGHEIEEIIIPDSVTSIGENALFSYKMKKLTFLVKGETLLNSDISYTPLGNENVVSFANLNNSTVIKYQVAVGGMLKNATGNETNVYLENNDNDFVTVPAGAGVTNVDGRLYLIYYITYKEIDETDMAGLSPSVYLGSKGLNKLPIPERGEDIFKGWYIDKELTQKAESISINDRGHKTFYAKWISNIAKSTANEIEKQVYTGNELKPKVVLKDGTITLEEGVDYTLSYRNNINASNQSEEQAPTIIITGIGKYWSTKEVPFNILKATITGITVTPFKGTYNGYDYDAIETVTGAPDESNIAYTYSTYSGTKWGAYNSSIPKIKYAGNMQVKIKGTVTNSNYNDYESEVVTAIMLKRPVTIVANDAVKEYNAENPTFTLSQVASPPLESGDTLDGFNITLSTEATTTSNAGNYDIIGTSTSDNYDVTIIPGTLEIKRRIAELEWHNTEFTYDGSEKIPTAKVSNKVDSDEVFVIVAGGKTDVGNHNATATDLTGKHAGNYTIDSEASATENFQINKSQFTGDLISYKDNVETSNFNYGDIITVKAPLTLSKLGDNRMSAFAVPTSNQMALFIGDEQITEPVDAIEGVYTMHYKTLNKDLSIGKNNISVKNVGDGNIADYIGNIEITLNQKFIAAAVDGNDDSASKEYDGTNNFKNVRLNTTGTEGADIIEATANGTVEDADVNINTEDTKKKFTATEVRLSGEDCKYYSIENSVVGGNVSITKANIMGSNQEMLVVKELEKLYTFDLKQVLPTLSDGVSFGGIAYTVEGVTNNDGVLLSEEPVDSAIVGNEITLNVTNVDSKDKTAKVKIKVNTTNYKDFISYISIKTIDKTTLTIDAEFADRVYNGSPHPYEETPVFMEGTNPVTNIDYTVRYRGVKNEEDLGGTEYPESEYAPNKAGRYELIFAISGESTESYVGEKIINFEITKKQIVVKPKDVSIKSNEKMPVFTWAIETGVAGETIIAINTDEIIIDVQKEGGKLENIEVGIFDIEFTTKPSFNLEGDTEKNYHITFEKGKLTVTKHSPGGSSTSGSVSESENTIIVLPTKEPNTPTKVSTPVVSTVTNGIANVIVSQATVSDAIKKAQAEAKKNDIAVEIKVDTKNITANNISANLPKATVDELTKAGVKELSINSDMGIISLDLETLKTIQDEINSDVTVSAKRVDGNTLSAEAQAVIGNRPVFDFTIIGSNGKHVTNFGKGKISISIPYTLGKNEKAENILAYYIDHEGNLHEMPDSVYNEKVGLLSFVTDHFSKFAVGYKEDEEVEQIIFTDIISHWAKKDIEFVTARDLFGGTAEGIFSPNMSMTRGMLVTVLGRLGKADLSSYKTCSFADVPSDAYYMPSIKWARTSGIVNGLSATEFGPNQPISREQLAVIIANYAKANGYELAGIQVENSFSDDETISSYAKKSVKQMQIAGLISGKEGNKFDPKGTATRAEVSAVLKRFIELIQKK